MAWLSEVNYTGSIGEGMALIAVIYLLHIQPSDISEIPAVCM